MTRSPSAVTGMSAVTWKTEDGSALPGLFPNKASCVQIVWVLDTAAPAIAPQGDITVKATSSAEMPASGFRYDAAADQYIFKADFRDKSAGTCWKVKIDLGDGSSPLESAPFKLQC
jgi:hypothetical protein